MPRPLPPASAQAAHSAQSTNTRRDGLPYVESGAGLHDIETPLWAEREIKRDLVLRSLQGLLAQEEADFAVQVTSVAPAPPPPKAYTPQFLRYRRDRKTGMFHDPETELRVVDDLLDEESMPKRERRYLYIRRKVLRLRISSPYFKTVRNARRDGVLPEQMRDEYRHRLVVSNINELLDGSSEEGKNGRSGEA